LEIEKDLTHPEKKKMERLILEKQKREMERKLKEKESKKKDGKENENLDKKNEMKKEKELQTPEQIRMKSLMDMFAKRREESKKGLPKIIKQENGDEERHSSPFDIGRRPRSKSSIPWILPVSVVDRDNNKFSSPTFTPTALTSPHDRLSPLFPVGLVRSGCAFIYDNNHNFFY
jgi:hypothetical protein